jgi:radical SAM superfamily enzyme YgiQ (UPF0313 family)
LVDLSSSDLLHVFHKYLDALKNLDHPIWKEMRQVIESAAPDVIGISFLSTKTGAVQNTIAIAKQINPNVPIVLGGAHPSILFKSSLEQSQADFAVLGEGEETFSELISFLEQERPDFEKIRGIAYKAPDGTILKTPPRPLIQDLDSLPFPDRESLYGLENYRPDDMSMIMTSRGCPFNCSFCSSIWERRTRYRSVSNIITEIEYLIRRFGVQNIYFKDDTFTLSRQRIFDFCDMLEQKNIQIHWECLTRIELIDEELVLRMRRAGMNNLKIGIETGSERLLRTTHKNISLEDVRRGASILNNLGQKWSAFFMLGYPDETEDEIRQSWRLIEEIKPTYVSMSILVPYPGCEIYYQLESRGIIHEHTDWNLYDPFSLYANASLVFNPERFRELAVAAMRFVDDYNSNSKNKSSKIAESQEIG